MNVTQMPLGRSRDYTPQHPDRTTIRHLPGAFGDVEYKEWRSREAMARAIRRQERGHGIANPPFGGWLRALVALETTEGY